MVKQIALSAVVALGVLFLVGKVPPLRKVVGI